MNYPQIAARLFNTPLLLHPGKLSAIVAGLSSRFSVHPAPDAYVTPAGTRTKGGYRALDNGIAIIEIFGALAHHGGMQGDSSYVEGYSTIARALDAAMSDPSIHSILLNIDSPGGEVAGAFQLAEQIRAARSIKPITAVASDMACSAAYLIASAATSLSVTRTGVVGSIGVVTCHADLSRHLDKEGIAITCIYAGAHKADGNPYQPLPPEVAAQIQADVDHYYTLFLTTVAAYRPQTDVAALRATEAQTYIGSDAIAAKLADRIETPDQAIARILSTRSQPSKGAVSTQALRSIMNEPETTPAPIPATSPAPEPAPAPVSAADRPLNAVSIVRLCNAAKEPLLAEVLVETPHTEKQVKNRLAQAAAVRRVCAIAKTPELADELVAAGATADAAMLATWQALADRSAAHPIDATPPQAAAGSVKRPQFEAMNAVQRRDFLRAGGSITD